MTKKECPKCGSLDTKVDYCKPTIDTFPSLAALQLISDYKCSKCGEDFYADY